MTNETKKQKPEEKEPIDWKGMRNKIVYATAFCTNSGTGEKLVLFDLEKEKATTIYERKRKDQAIEGIKSFDGGVLISISGQECHKLDIKSGKPKRILGNMGEGYIDFTSAINGRLAYAVSCRGDYPSYDDGKGNLYLFDLESGKSHLISESKKQVGCVAFNGKNLTFTRIVDSSDGWSPGGGYEEENDSRLEYLISLEIVGSSIGKLGEILSKRKTHVSHMAMNDNGALSYVYNSRALFGDISFDWYKPEITGIDYLSNDKLAAAGRFVTSDRLGEGRKYWSGIKILRDNKVIHEIEIKDGIDKFSVVRGE